MSTLSEPRPLTSSGASSWSAKDGTFWIETRSVFPLRHSAVTAMTPPARFEHKMPLGLLHRQNAGVEQDRRDADRVRPQHRRRVFRLHDDKTHLRRGVLGGDKQIDVPKDAAARLVED